MLSRKIIDWFLLDRKILRYHINNPSQLSINNHPSSLFPPILQMMKLLSFNQPIPGFSQLSITDLLGNEIYHQQLQTLNFKLQTSSFPNGMYIIKAYTGKGVFQKKLSLFTPDPKGEQQSLC